VAITRDQITTDVAMLRGPSGGKIKWYWKVSPTNEATTPMIPDSENPRKYLKNPDQYFEGIRGTAETRSEAQALVNANVANLLENGVAGITAL